MRSFGTVIQEHAAPAAEALVSESVLDRFRDIVAYTTGTMPTVLLEHRYEFGGDEVLALAMAQGRVLAFNPQSRVADWLNLRTFAVRGTHLGPAKGADLAVPLMAVELAHACEVPVGVTEIETVEAVVSFVGIEAAEHYFDALCSDEDESALDVYLEGDLDSLLADAAIYAEELARVSE